MAAPTVAVARRWRRSIGLLRQSMDRLWLGSVRRPSPVPVALTLPPPLLLFPASLQLRSMSSSPGFLVSPPSPSNCGRRRVNERGAGEIQILQSQGLREREERERERDVKSGSHWLGCVVDF
ncbi:1D-myo-inositol2-acetamido-2-deoxy-alpha-D-glucopyranoside deacetylase 1 [Striga asiatica]|uniref:1D-myo-inositol2-acetamido-2-deoxy-alpha-D-glucopyranoside deacetylase 1 n=1 Tax=Striga asiatica TaxID=4170 RepID=A0A5A7Q8J3_STRAF|nr:1D-myo-inositol2-acetamido-2-deoxy-alpha-D-glucopyranoside deacetylase 1 [Striga asiatica]